MHFSCRFAKPLITFQKETEILKDTVEIIKAGGFFWDEFRHCPINITKDSIVHEHVSVPLKGNENLRDYLGHKTIIKSWEFIGFYQLTKVYDKRDHLIEEGRSKLNFAHMYDGNLRSSSKYIYYDTIGKVYRIDYWILQHHGIPARIVMNRTRILYGKEWLKIDNRDTAQLGWSALANNDCDNALAYLQMLLKKDSTSLGILINLAHAYLFTGNYTRAMAIYKKYRGQRIRDMTWEEMVDLDFATLAPDGLSTKLMNRVLKELNLQILPKHLIKDRFE